MDRTIACISTLCAYPKLGFFLMLEVVMDYRLFFKHCVQKKRATLL